MLITRRCSTLLLVVALLSLTQADGWSLTIEPASGGGALVPEGAPWSYLKGIAAPSAPADDWQQIGFDDSTWAIGPAGFGYDDGDDATPLDDMEDSYVSVYIRHEFTLTSPPAELPLELSVDYDDGFVAYINGAEVARSSNMPAGAPTFETTTSDNHEAGTTEVFTLGDASNLLVGGSNVLAVEGHNTSLGSSDFSLHPSLRTAAAGGVQIFGDRWVVRGSRLALQGVAPEVGVSAVSVNFENVPFDPATSAWTAEVDLPPGRSTVFVASLGEHGESLAEETVEVVSIPESNVLSGTLAGDATWGGGVIVDGDLVVPVGATLTIGPGTIVLLDSNVSIEVRGQLLAEGTANEPIRWTRYGDSGQWGRLMFVDAGDSRLRHCIVEFSDCEGDHKDYYDDDCDESTTPPSRTYFQAVVAISSHLDIEDCLFQNLPDASSSAEGDAIAIIADDPDVPGSATANIRRSQFIGIGQGVHTRYAPVVIEECFFTRHNGDNDDIDLYGESDPPPLVLNNVLIDPGHDDMINPTRCSAILIGNVVAGSDDHGIVLRDKCRPILINNLVYDCSAAAISIQNQCDALLINNTLVNCGRGVRFFDHTGRWDPPYCLFPGSGKATLINCIIRDCPTPFDLEDSPRAEDRGSHVTVMHCLVDGGQGAASVSSNSTVTWGAGNIDVDPEFADEAGENFRLSSALGRWDPETAAFLVDAATSPCIDAGMDVLAQYPELAKYLVWDFDRSGRALDGDGEGTAAFDIGAFEAVAPSGDSNGDSVPDGWYREYGMNAATPGLGEKNFDGDALTNYEEWIADTSPTDSSSSFLPDFILGEGTLSIEFWGSQQREYSLFETGDLVTWNPVEGQQNVTSHSRYVMDVPATSPRRIYQVRITVPE